MTSAIKTNIVSEKPSGATFKKVLRSAPATIMLWIMVCVYAFPVLWLLLSSFKGAGELFRVPLTFLPENWDFSGYARAWEQVDFALYFRNTAIVAVITTILTVCVSCVTGYALAKYDRWWVRAFFMALLLTTMLPTEVIMSPAFLVVRDLGLYNSLPGIIVPSIITATGIFMFRQFFMTVPDDMLQAARIDGASELQLFMRIMVPISRPIAVTLAIFSFQWRWNDYIWPLLILNDPKQYTLQVALRALGGAEHTDWTVLRPAAGISMIPLVLIFIVFQRYITNANMDAGFKG